MGIFTGVFDMFQRRTKVASNSHSEASESYVILKITQFPSKLKTKDEKDEFLQNVAREIKARYFRWSWGGNYIFLGMPHKPEFEEFFLWSRLNNTKGSGEVLSFMEEKNKKIKEKLLLDWGWIKSNHP